MLEEGDIVLCTVDRIVGTVVFVNIEGNREGSIITSEIAPGRIRNLRDYVVPKKQIVCKVLRIQNGNINLSLRRVTQKEQKEVKEKYKQEKSYTSLLKSILKEKHQEVIDKIKESESIYEFFQKIDENSERLKKIAGNEEFKKIIEILSSQKQKKSIVKKEFFLKTTDPEGIILIKKILSLKDADISYISAGRYSVKSEEKNLKSADSKIREILESIETQAKKQGMEFAIKEK